ncbi:hypothetical protein PRUPE_5G052100 [Prunus persica]|uniref:Uncharacterized protein n=1 Tax=Prunus persica TaxID=3760 RepID=A0A251P436_PRUPE|nr:hypothetical protein PRUPE_5G052100 [Prunus persica]
MSILIALVELSNPSLQLLFIIPILRMMTRIRLLRRLRVLLTRRWRRCAWHQAEGLQILAFAVRWFLELLQNCQVAPIKFDVVEQLGGIASHDFKDEDSFKVVQRRASESTKVVIVNRRLSLASLFLQSRHLV